mgnify:CR=1 FL=1
MNEMYGYAGKILRINLTSKTTEEVPITNYVPKYVGGRSIANKSPLYCTVHRVSYFLVKGV